jgi:hypothetical protein
MNQVVVVSTTELEAMLEKVVKNAIQAIPAAQKSNTGKYITKAEAAEICRCSVKTIETRLKEGVFRYRKDGNSKASRVLILADDVHKSITQRLTDHRFK